MGKVESLIPFRYSQWLLRKPLITSPDALSYIMPLLSSELQCTPCSLSSHFSFPAPRWWVLASVFPFPPPRPYVCNRPQLGRALLWMSEWSFSECWEWHHVSLWICGEEECSTERKERETMISHYRVTNAWYFSGYRPKSLHDWRKQTRISAVCEWR